MHQPLLSRPDEALSDVRSLMCLFWDLEASSCTLYQQMAACEACPVRADAWRKLQNCRLLVGQNPANHDVYVSQKLLADCKEAIRQDSLNLTVEKDRFSLMTRIMQLKFLQVTLVASLRQQTSLILMLDVGKFSTSVALVTHLVLSARGH